MTWAWPAPAWTTGSCTSPGTAPRTRRQPSSPPRESRSDDHPDHPAAGHPAADLAAVAPAGVVDDRVAQPGAHPPDAGDAARRHGAVGDVRPALRLRVRRRDRRRRLELPGVPAARDHGADHGVLL